MSLLTVGIGECIVSRDPGAVLATHALGSCVAVAVYDPAVHVAGLLHFLLPDSGTDRGKADARPFIFADTGIPRLFHGAYSMGANRANLITAAFGGAHVTSGGDALAIGKRNCLAVRKILWKAGLMLHHEELGGTAPRTVHIEAAHGRVVISHGQAQRELFLQPARRILTHAASSLDRG